MTLKMDEFKHAQELALCIAASYKAATDVEEEAASLPTLVEAPDSVQYRDARREAGRAGYELLERETASVLIPDIREFIPDYPNPFNPEELDTSPGEDIPF